MTNLNMVTKALNILLVIYTMMLLNLCSMLPQMSVYIQSIEKVAKMYFIIKNNAVLVKYISKNGIKAGG